MSWEAGGDLTACARIVERGDPDRFASAMAAPVAAREALFPLYAFNIEVSRAPWVTAEPMIAGMRLQWWADALEEIAVGGTIRRHEVVTPLARVLDATSARQLQTLVEARQADIDKAPFDDGAALISYLDATGGLLMATAARALGDRDGRAARALGTAAGVAAYLCAVPELVARGKLPLPDGRPEAVRDLARQGRARLAEARAARSDVVPAARPALWPGALAGPVLARAEQAPQRVSAGDLMPSEARVRMRRLWVAATGRW